MGDPAPPSVGSEEVPTQDPAEEVAMIRCRICRFEVPLDDISIRFAAGDCICVVCFAREVHDEKHMSATVRRDAQRTADQAD